MKCWGDEKKRNSDGKGMLFHYLKDPESEQYFEQLSLGITGKIDVELFKKTWNFVIKTNEILRAVFRW